MRIALFDRFLGCLNCSFLTIYAEDWSCSVDACWSWVGVRIAAATCRAVLAIARALRILVRNVARRVSTAEVGGTRREKLSFGETSAFKASKAARMPSWELILGLVVRQLTRVQLTEQSWTLQASTTIVVGETDQCVELVVCDRNLNGASHTTFKTGKVSWKYLFGFRFSQRSWTAPRNTMNSVLRQIIWIVLTGVAVTDSPDTYAIFVARTWKAFKGSDQVDSVLRSWPVGSTLCSAFVRAGHRRIFFCFILFWLKIRNKLLANDSFREKESSQGKKGEIFHFWLFPVIVFFL